MNWLKFVKPAAVLLLLGGCGGLLALNPYVLQDTNVPPPPPEPRLGNRPPVVAQDPTLDRMTRQMERRRNSERQKAMVHDAEQLLKAANELNQEVAKSEGKLSLDATRKAEEVARLARQVQEKMRGF